MMTTQGRVPRALWLTAMAAAVAGTAALMAAIGSRGPWSLIAAAAAVVTVIASLSCVQHWRDTQQRLQQLQHRRIRRRRRLLVERADRRGERARVEHREVAAVLGHHRARRQAAVGNRFLQVEGRVAHLDRAPVEQVGHVQGQLQVLVKLHARTAGAHAQALEAGRGFAVVADEVRSLASRTQQATGEIQKMIQQVQSRVAETVNVMQSSQTLSNQGVNRSEEIKLVLSKVTDLVSNISNMNIEVSHAAQEQTCVTEAISRTLNDLANVSGSASLDSEHLAQSSERLFHQGERLRTLVTSFRL